MRILAWFRRRWLLLLTGVLLLTFYVADAALKRTPLEGYCPQDARWIAATEHFGAFWSGLRLSPAWARLQKEMGDPLREQVLEIRKAVGIRPVPIRWTVWMGDRLLAAESAAGTGICVHPGLLLRVVDRFRRNVLRIAAQEDIYTYGGYYYAWREGFLIVSKSRDYVRATLSANAPVLESSRARNELRLTLPNARIMGDAAKRVPPYAVLRFRGESGWPVEGRLRVSIGPRKTPLTLANAWPEPPLCAITASKWSDVAAILSLAEEWSRDWAVRRPLDALVTETWAHWQLDRPAPEWDAQVDQCSLALFDLDTSETLPIPEIALILRGAYPNPREHPLASLAPRPLSIPYEWNGQRGAAMPLLGEKLTLCLGRDAGNWLVTSQEPLMAALMEGRASSRPPVAEKALTGETPTEADLAIRLNWRKLGQALEAVLKKAGALELIPRKNEAEVEADYVPIAKAIAELGTLELDARGGGEYLTFKGRLANTEERMNYELGMMNPEGKPAPTVSSFILHPSSFILRPRYVFGNGGLTVGADAFGRIIECRWPSPSFHSQITGMRPTQAFDSNRGHGLVWGLRVNGQTLWLAGEPWQASEPNRRAPDNTIETLAVLPNTPITVRQTLSVHPRKDILLVRLTVAGADSPPGIYWYANFSPRTRLVPEVPAADWALDSRGDFAVFASEHSQTIYHFRPEHPSGRDWEHAERLAEHGASPSEWSSFSEGVWIGYRGLNTVQGFQCGVQEGATSAFAQANDGALQGAAAAVGQCESAIELLPSSAGEREYTVTVAAAFGRSLREVDENLDYVVKQGFDNLLIETQSYWQEWLGRARLPEGLDAELRDLAYECLLVLANVTDRGSGAMVRAPITHPPLALDWPRHGVWMTLALNQAGYTDIAEKHTLFYAGTVRGTSVPGKPAGSLPAACYANGEEGLPHVILDVDAAAWTLWSFSQHALFLEPSARKAYLEKVWPATDLAADFLANWADHRSGDPLPSFDPGLRRDAQNVETLLRVYTGLRAALAIADATGNARPEWRDRQNELKALALHRCFGTRQEWKIGDPLSSWPAALIPADDPRWDAPIADAVNTLESGDPDAVAVILCNLAMLLKDQPAKLSLLRPVMKAALMKAVRPASPHAAPAKAGTHSAFPDALRAARCLIAIKTAFRD